MTKFFQSNAKPVVLAIAAALMIIGALTLSDALAQVSPSAATDASTPTSAPTAKVVGWRGDGTGRYPDATPPTEWYLKANGESKNILWKAKLPCYSLSTPIVVGGKIVTRSEPFDLLCLDKKTGKILWMHAITPLVALTDDEKKAYPGYKAAAKLLEQLEELNDRFVKSGWTEDLYTKKYNLQRQMNDEIDAKYKLPRDGYLSFGTGYTGTTPVSDGKYIYFNSGNGVIACYDLNGNKKWARYESVIPIWFEHGFANQPTISADLFIAQSCWDLHAFNKETGVDVWKKKMWEQYTTAYPFTFGGTEYIIYGTYCIRSKDGKVMASKMPIETPVVIDDVVYYGPGTCVETYKIEAGADGGLSLRPLITDEYNRIRVGGIAGWPDNPILKVDPSISGYGVATPLYDNGLLYCLGNFGWMGVVDVTKTKLSDGMIVYHNLPPFDFKNPYNHTICGLGLCASPILAGKYIYMTDSAGCTLVIEPGRKFKLIAKNNINCTVPEQPPLNGIQRSYTGPHQEQNESSMIADGNCLYIRGEQFLYCIGEK